MTDPTGDIWVVLQVGCIECGDVTDVVGVYDDEAPARAEFDRLAAGRDPTGNSISAAEVAADLADPDSTTVCGHAGYLQLHRFAADGWAVE